MALMTVSEASVERSFSNQKWYWSAVLSVDIVNDMLYIRWNSVELLPPSQVVEVDSNVDSSDVEVSDRGDIDSMIEDAPQEPDEEVPLALPPQVEVRAKKKRRTIMDDLYDPFQAEVQQ